MGARPRPIAQRRRCLRAALNNPATKEIIVEPPNRPTAVGNPCRPSADQTPALSNPHSSTPGEICGLVTGIVGIALAFPLLAWVLLNSSSSRYPIVPKCWSRCSCRKAPVSRRQPPQSESRGWLKQQPEAKIVTSYIGQGAPRFFLRCPGAARSGLREDRRADRRRRGARGLEASSAGRDGAGARAGSLCARHAACVRPLLAVSGRVSGHGPRSGELYASPKKRSTHAGRSGRAAGEPRLGQSRARVRFVLDQDRLNLIGLSPAEAAQQLQFLLTGVRSRRSARTSATWPRGAQRRRRAARSGAPHRLHPHLPGRAHDSARADRPSEVRMEDPPEAPRSHAAVTVRSDIDEAPQPPEVSTQIKRPCSRSSPASRRLSHRDGRLDRGIGQGQRGASQDLPDHARATLTSSCSRSAPSRP